MIAQDLQLIKHQMGSTLPGAGAGAQCCGSGFTWRCQAAPLPRPLLQEEIGQSPLESCRAWRSPGHASSDLLRWGLGSLVVLWAQCQGSLAQTEML